MNVDSIATILMYSLLAAPVVGTAGGLVLMFVDWKAATPEPLLPARFAADLLMDIAQQPAIDLARCVAEPRKAPREKQLRRESFFREMDAAHNDEADSTRLAA